MKYNVLVEGPYLTQSGYGEHARLVLQSLKEREDVEIYGFPLQWGKTSWLSDDDENRTWLDSISNKINVKPPEKFDLHVFIGVPSEFQKKAEKAVCVTAGIEVDRVSPSWLLKSHELDKIIVPSKHSKEVFEKSSYKTQEENPETLECASPVEVVPYAVGEYDPDPVFSKELTKSLKNNFNFLCVAQWGPRKNIENMVSWFVDEFAEEEVGLVLKTNFARNSNMDYEYCKRNIEKLLSTKQKDRKCKVILLHGDLTESQLGSLYTNSKVKAIVSATHGEGFGLPLFEAVCHELPVCATNATGHVDFLYAENKKGLVTPHFAPVEFFVSEVPDQFVWEDIIEQGSKWCYPTPESFKSAMRNIYKDYRKYRSFAKKLRVQIKEQFSYDRVTNMMAEATLSPVLEEIQDLKVEVYN